MSSSVEPSPPVTSTASTSLIAFFNASPISAGVFADGMHRVDLVPGLEQLAGGVAAGGVEDPARGQFVADGNDLYLHP